MWQTQSAWRSLSDGSQRISIDPATKSIVWKYQESPTHNFFSDRISNAVRLGNGNTLYLDTDKNLGATNSRFSAFPTDWNQGLVTGFNDVGVSQTPLPAALPLFASGLAALGLFRWRRNLQKAA